MTAFDSARRAQPALQALRRDFHAHPELAFAEERTAALVAEQLTAAGIETHRGIGGTGVVGVIRAGNSPRAIGLRADMDALPVAEANTFAHRSTIAGCMHACGHDGHVTMLLGAAKILAETRHFDGTVYVIFQPAEEGEGGADSMVRDGLFTRFPMQAIFGMHNWPGLPAGSFAVHDGAVMAGTDRFDIRIEGQGGHAGMPHLARDPIVAGTALVQAFQSVVARTLDPLASGVVSITRFHAGDAYNVLPASAEISGTVRSLSEDVRRTVFGRLRELSAGIASAYGVKVDFEPLSGAYPPTINTPAEAALCIEVAAAVVGREHVITHARPSMGAEDFSFYLREKPGAYIWIGNDPAGGSASLHNPHYDFNDDILPLGVAYWVELVQRVLG
jgi:hippurate hydrolase